MKTLLATAALVALAMVRIALFVLGIVGLRHDLGLAWALAGAGCLIVFRFSVPIRVGIFLAAISLWHWPWYAALILAAPRLMLPLPGLISTGLAKLRHPRPLWPSTQAN